VVVRRLALDRIGSAHGRLSAPHDPTAWGFDAVADAPDPADRVTLDESVNMALLVVLEAMTPAERVTFILHDVFHYSFAEIGEIVGRSSEACRKLASSARRRVDGPSSLATPPAEQALLVTAFQQAWEAQDVRALVEILDPDATVVVDGGGLANAARRPITGGPRLARYLARLAGKGVEFDLHIVETTVNGNPGLAGHIGGRTVLVLAFGVEGNRIRNLWAVVNPEKLLPWNSNRPTDE
jgi:RNA polymerase sigma-70 factor (ECF subfamily)